MRQTAGKTLDFPHMNYLSLEWAKQYKLVPWVMSNLWKFGPPPSIWCWKNIVVCDHDPELQAPYFKELLRKSSACSGVGLWFAMTSIVQYTVSLSLVIRTERLERDGPCWLLTNGALVIRVQMRGEGESCGVSANEYSGAHHVTWSPNNFGDLPPYLTMVMKGALPWG
jgi:hypothetical protein